MDASSAYTFLADLVAELPPITPDGIISRTVFKSPTLKAVLFSFDSGQELSEHTSTHAAVIHILQGDVTLRLGSDEHDAKPNTWAYMPPNLPHAVLAKTPTVMLLLMEGA